MTEARSGFITNIEVDMRSRLISMLALLFSFSVAVGADSPALSVAIEGRGGIEARAQGDATYGMIETAVLAKERVTLTVTAIGVASDEWPKFILWHVTSESGSEVLTAPRFIGMATPPNAAV